MLALLLRNEWRVHLCGLAPRRHSSEETSELWHSSSHTVSHLTGPGIEPQTYHTDSDVVTRSVSLPFQLQFCIAMFLRVGVRVVPLGASPVTLSIFAMKEGRVENLMESISDEIKQSNLSIDLSVFSLCEVKDFRILKVLVRCNVSV